MDYLKSLFAGSQIPTGSPNTQQMQQPANPVDPNQQAQMQALQNMQQSGQGPNLDPNKVNQFMQGFKGIR